MKTSIIIPAKDEAKNLERLIPAMLEQGVPPMEIIVAVAPSTSDATRKVVDRYAPHARWVVGGMPGAGRNAGARDARGDLLVFLDADTVPTASTFLGRVGLEMDSRGLDIAGVDNEPRTGNRWYRAFYAIAQNPLMRAAALTAQPYAIGTCIIARRAAHEAIGGFDESIAFAEDVEYVQRAVGAGHRFGILDRGTRVLTSPRRLEKDGIARVCGMALRGELERRVRKRHITSIGEIDPDYFTHS